MLFNKEAFGNDSTKLVSYTGNQLDPEGVLNPCGKIARNFFNDRFTLYREKDKQPILINETNIAYEADKKLLFKRGDNTTQWIDVEDEHFIVWMNMETFNGFTKKWGSVEQDLLRGNYTLFIDYQWPVEKYQAKKKFVISSATGFGTASFFGWALIKASVICFLSVVILLITRVTQKTKFDEADLFWE